MADDKCNTPNLQQTTPSSYAITKRHTTHFTLQPNRISIWRTNSVILSHHLGQVYFLSNTLILVNANLLGPLITTNYYELMSAMVWDHYLRVFSGYHRQIMYFSACYTLFYTIHCTLLEIKVHIYVKLFLCYWVGLQQLLEFAPYLPFWVPCRVCLWLIVDGAVCVITKPFDRNFPTRPCFSHSKMRFTDRVV